MANFVLCWNRKKDWSVILDYIHCSISLETLDCHFAHVLWRINYIMEIQRVQERRSLSALAKWWARQDRRSFLSWGSQKDFRSNLAWVIGLGVQFLFLEVHIFLQIESIRLIFCLLQFPIIFAQPCLTLDLWGLENCLKISYSNFDCEIQQGRELLGFWFLENLHYVWSEKPNNLQILKFPLKIWVLYFSK